MRHIIVVDVSRLEISIAEEPSSRENRPKDATALLALLDACDDVAPWTPDDARRWWAERGPAVPAPPESRGNGSLPVLTLEIAMDRRVL